MSDDDSPIKVPVGDASHLLDKEPASRLDVSRGTLPLEIGEPDGSATTLVDPGSGRPASIRAEVVDAKGPSELIEEAKAQVEPCGSCRHFSWPKAGSDEWHEREAFIVGAKRSLPAGFGHIWPHGGPPEQFGSCSEAEVIVSDGVNLGSLHGNALVHYLRPGCTNYRPRAGGMRKADDAV